MRFCLEDLTVLVETETDATIIIADGPGLYKAAGENAEDQRQRVREELFERKTYRSKAQDQIEVSIQIGNRINFELPELHSPIKMSSTPHGSQMCMIGVPPTISGGAILA